MNRFLLVLLLLVVFHEVNSQIQKDNHNLSVDYIRNAKTLIIDERYNEAIFELKLAIKLDSTIRDAYLLMYKASYYADETDTIKVYLKKAKTIFVEDDEIIYCLAKVYQIEKDYENALIEYSEAIKFGKINGEDIPGFYDYYASRGVCFLFQNKYNEAINDFNNSIRFDATKGSVYANKGIALYKLKKNDEACKSWDQAFELGETSVAEYIEKLCTGK